MGIGLNIDKPNEKGMALHVKDPSYPRTYDDGAFTVDHGVHGYQSFDADGHKIIYSPNPDHCEYWTRAWLKAKQDGGWPDDQDRVVNDGVVGGKL